MSHKKNQTSIVKQKVDAPITPMSKKTFNLDPRYTFELFSASGRILMKQKLKELLWYIFFALGVVAAILSIGVVMYIFIKYIKHGN